jgi:hypothetical protein
MMCIDCQNRYWFCQEVQLPDLLLYCFMVLLVEQVLYKAEIRCDDDNALLV